MPSGFCGDSGWMSVSIHIKSRSRHYCSFTRYSTDSDSPSLQLRKGQNNCDMKMQLVDAWTSCRASSARAALCVSESCAELTCSVAVCPSLGLDVLCHPSCRVSGVRSLFTLYLHGCFCSDYSQELPDKRRTACTRSWTCPTSETLLGHSH